MNDREESSFHLFSSLRRTVVRLKMQKKRIKKMNDFNQGSVLLCVSLLQENERLNIRNRIQLEMNGSKKHSFQILC
jgi:hypothetical protein